MLVQFQAPLCTSRVALLGLSSPHIPNLCKVGMRWRHSLILTRQSHFSVIWAIQALRSMKTSVKTCKLCMKPSFGEALYLWSLLEKVIAGGLQITNCLNVCCYYLLGRVFVDTIPPFWVSDMKRNCSTASGWKPYRAQSASRFWFDGLLKFSTCHIPMDHSAGSWNRVDNFLDSMRTRQPDSPRSCLLIGGETRCVR